VRTTTGIAAGPGGARLYWESTGSGEPVLLIMGLGMAATAWWRTVPVLARGLRVITFDNRGVGRSTAPRRARTTSAMAADAVAVLDAADEESAHVYGISLGGMVAQQIALEHPDRVRALVLGATHAGGSGAKRADAETSDFFRRRARLPAEEAAWGSVPYAYGPRCRAEHGDRIAADIALRLEHPLDPGAYRAQIIAAARHDAARALDRIDAPTLVVHGVEDRMVPHVNAHFVAGRIAGAELLLLPDAGHLYPTEDPSADEAIAAFLNRCRIEVVSGSVLRSAHVHEHRR
jgi:pimeloyl-ACP methyl ester carboxylesterase